VTIVDVHAHLAVAAAEALVDGSPGLAAEVAEEQAGHSAASMEVNRAQLRRVIPRMADPALRLADMDAMGIDRQIVGPMPMHHYWADPALGARYARTVNEGVAEHCAAAAARLTGLATVPLQHPAAAVAELRYAVGELGLAGASVSTTVNGRELADPAHEEFWSAVEELDVMVFVHPWGCSLGTRLAAHYLGNTVGQPTETAVALSHVIFSGLLDRHPRLRLCAAHGGGYLPTYVGRSDHAWLARADARGCAEPPSSYLRRLWFDALVYTGPALAHLVETAGAGRVVLGTDYPFDMGVSDPVDRIELATSVTQEERRAILGENAAVLLGSKFTGVQS
jgi:aminocarboxymuconate-semialdehyde decarboxylase